MDKDSSQYSVYYRVQAANSRGKAVVYKFLSLALRRLLNQQLTGLCGKGQGCAFVCMYTYEILIEVIDSGWLLTLCN